MTIDRADLADTLEILARLCRAPEPEGAPPDASPGFDAQAYKAALLAVSQGGVRLLQRALGGIGIDGDVGPKTRDALGEADLTVLLAAICPQPSPPLAPPSGEGPNTIQEADINKAANVLGCSPAFVHAVIDVEVGAPSVGTVAGFINDGRPDILFESHQFHRHTNGQFDLRYPDLSTDSWVRNYGKGGAHQWERLYAAMELDRDAAIRSASWGMFQIMGDEFEEAGFNSLDDFVEAIKTGQQQHLSAFVSVILHRPKCLSAAQADPPLFAQFARYYNGAGYAANQYDTKLAAAYQSWAKKLAGSQV